MECLAGLLAPVMLIIILGFVIQFFLTRRAVKDLRVRLDRLEAVVAERTLAPLPADEVIVSSSVSAAGPIPPPALPATPSPTALTAPAAAPAIAPRPGPTLPAAPLDESPAPTTAPAIAPPLGPPKTPWYTAVPVLEWFARAHLLVQIGLAVLFIGVAFLLKFAVDQGWISIELRHVGVVIGALALGGVGWWLRTRRRIYGLALQGGALAILYLTTYSAFRLYELIPAPVAFGIFFGLGVVGCGLALFGNAAILAFLATAGAFAAPVLTASGAGSYAVLFGYYALLNVGVLAIAIFKSWHGLNLVSFLFTFGVGMTYTFANYAPADYGGMQAFVLFFFVLYLTITILVTLRSERRGPASISVSLALGLPFAALLWQGMITDHLPHGLGYSALAGAAIYLVVAGFLFYRPKERLSTLREIFLFLGLLLGTLAMPSFFSQRVTAAIWAISGAAWVWLGEGRRARWMPLWGAVVQGLAGFAFGLSIAQESWLDFTANPLYAGPLFLSPFFVSCAILGLAGMGAAFALYRQAWQPAAGTSWASLRPILSILLLGWGLLWWFGGGVFQIVASSSEVYVISGIVAYLALSCAAVYWAGERLAWPALRAPMFLLLPALFGLALLQPFTIQHPLEGGAWYAWPLALLVWYWTLWRMDRTGQAERSAYLTFAHAGGLWLFAYLAAMAAASFLWHWTDSSTLAAAAALGSLAAIIAAAADLTPRFPRPIGNHAVAYQTWGAGPVTGAALLYLVFAVTVVNGEAGSLPYLPLLNPMDLASAAVLAAALYWLVRTRPLIPAGQRSTFWLLRWVWGAALLYVLSLSLARAVHQLTGVSFSFDALFGSELLQALLSIVWGGLALVLMLAARFRRSRALWAGGAIVLALTVLKLFVVDLSNVGTIARIAAFIGVGLLIIVIAFFAPVPPKREAAETSATQALPPPG